MALNVVEELGVLDAHRDLRGKGGQPFLVLGVEGPSSLVEHLAYADRLARLAEDRHAEDRPGEKAGLLVEGRVEAQIGIGVGYVDGFSRSKNCSGYAEVIGNPNG